MLRVIPALLALAAFVAGCGRSHATETTVIGPRLGESVAVGPSDPNVPPPDATGPTEISVPIAHPPSGPAPSAPTAAPTPGSPAESSPPITPPTTPPSPSDGGSPGVFAPPPQNP
ncbi:MAG: hypothetical protein ABI867_20925 [Kofleriaceae bacterium]